MKSRPKPSSTPAPASPAPETPTRADRAKALLRFLFKTFMTMGFWPMIWCITNGPRLRRAALLARARWIESDYDPAARKPWLVAVWKAALATAVGAEMVGLMIIFLSMPFARVITLANHLKPGTISLAQQALFILFVFLPQMYAVTALTSAIWDTIYPAAKARALATWWSQFPLLRRRAA